MNLVPVVNWFLGLSVQKFNDRPHITYAIRPEAKSLSYSSHHMLLYIVGTTYICEVAHNDIVTIAVAFVALLETNAFLFCTFLHIFLGWLADQLFLYC